MIQRLIVGAACAAVFLASPAAAQVRPRAEQRAQRLPPQRGQLEQQVRRRMFEVVRTRVGLDDGQMRRLQAVNERIEPQRRDLLQQERETRAQLRALMIASQPDQAKIDAGLRTLMQIQRRRLDLVEGEQQELAKFMTPLQRARFGALQEQMRRRLEQLRQRRQQQGAGAALLDTPPS